MRPTPKDFFLWLGALIALYGSVIAFINLLFSYVDYAYPDALYSYVDPYSGGMRFAMATLIVLVPLAIVLMRFIRKDIELVPQKSDLWVRRWALVLTLFLAGSAMIVDLITLVNVFLGGELTTRFVLKVAVVFLVAGGFFLHFWADIKGYWGQYPKRAQIVGIGAGILVLAAIVSGFFIMGTPSEIRELRMDNRRVSDLQTIQWQVVNYWQQKEELPQTLSDLEDPLTGFIAPKDPETNEPYEYQLLGGLTFELCATFNRESQNHVETSVPVFPPRDLVYGFDNTNWQHDAGSACFERTIDPERFPPMIKPAI